MADRLFLERPGAADRLLTVPQVADELRMTPQTIRNWIEAGVLPAVRIGRAYRLRRGDVDAMIAAGRVAGSAVISDGEMWAPAVTRLTRRAMRAPAPTIWDAASSELARR
jgi:excisionase family DNA binding protein